MAKAAAISFGVQIGLEALYTDDDGKVVDDVVVAVATVLAVATTKRPATAKAIVSNITTWGVAIGGIIDHYDGFD
jgi:hypothetical protein